jgi:methyltransferase-like protein
MTSLQAIPRSNPDFTVRDVGEEIIFISAKGDMLHTLDSVGAFIWRNIDGKRSLKDILEILLESYDVVVATAEQDILRFFDELEQKNIVQMSF